MNPPIPPNAPMTMPADADDEINLAEYLDIFLDNRWLIAGITAVAVVLGGLYAFLARPVYETNLLIQVEDSDNSAKSFLGDAAASFLQVKTPAGGEIEILRSRLVLNQAVENTKLYIDARPRYTPLIGSWLSRQAKELSTPGILGLGGFVSGAEKIVVPQMEVPAGLEQKPFTIEAKGHGQYLLTQPDLPEPLQGTVGVLLDQVTSAGRVQLLVAQLEGKEGAQFRVSRSSKLAVVDKLQDDLKISEKGKQSGVIDVTLQDTDPQRLTVLLNEIGRQYVRQNINRKAAEAEKTLVFLDTQLPQFKKQLEVSEDTYSKYRNLHGTISLDDEAKAVLAQTVEQQSKLVEAQQRRRDLEARFTGNHPTIQTLDAQIAAYSKEIAKINDRIKSMPVVQQDALRMERDIKVNTDLYQSLLNSAIQLRLAKEGKVGNVRLLDDAVVPEDPVKPKKALVLALAAVLGLLIAAVTAVVRTIYLSGIKNPQEIEAHTGLNVYSTIPLSATQAMLAQRAAGKMPGIHLLASEDPSDSAIESLRSLRTALQFAMLEAGNNRVLITGGTPGVGKSFISTNFAAIMAAAGKKTLLIDGDLRKGHINQYFGLARERGLSELIAGGVTLKQALRPEVLKNLDFLPTGVMPPNPAELMMSDSFASLLKDLSSQYDLVIIDTPPVLVAADTAAVANHAGTVLLVARANKSSMGELIESTRRLAHAGKAANGVLFNAMDMSRRSYYGYGYKYGRYRYIDYKYRNPAS
ncbi:polysaccharide biosynthesis tyrosine autokinase [Variovorax terrae]|uniref:Putative tyrosine-protein kinase EpsB n=1 Tax=Variovorax terrae TaxID=2923278 RepID=A0A9X1W1D2_9BURK|nr:polysaccharide biosynthesis tyrosine autokinase [Variovorax terrae]MCJ0764333.1 polysaccharide biosynthesis tyrosine autokinase [Variovorax terrae]